MENSANYNQMHGHMTEKEFQDRFEPKPITIVLIGAQASGKSTLEKWVDEELKIPRLVSHTTRPIREIEDGSEYHFVSEDEFMDIFNADGFIEHRAYTVAGGETWYYGLAKSSIYAPLHVAVLDYKGFAEFRKEHDCIGIHIFIDREECFNRVEEFRPGYPMDEAIRRFESDVVDIQLPATEDPLVFQMDSRCSVEESREALMKYIKLAQDYQCERTLGPSAYIEFGDWGWRRALEGQMSVSPSQHEAFIKELAVQKNQRLQKVLKNLEVRRGTTTK